MMHEKEVNLMANTLKILQIGHSNWQDHYTIPNNVEWLYSTGDMDELTTIIHDEKGRLVKPFSAVIFTDEVLPQNTFALLMPVVSAYAVYYSEQANQNELIRSFFTMKMARQLSFDSVERVVAILAKTHFSRQYGQSSGFDGKYVTLNPNFHGNVEYLGNDYVKLSGKFSENDHFMPTASFRFQLNYEGIPLEVWPEFKTEGDIEVLFKVYTMQAGSSVVTAIREYTQAQLNEPMLLEESDQITEGYYGISLLVKGEGTVYLGTVHHRHSRLGFGQFILGGERLVSQDRQELIAYFNPGDLKPPLNIYFSGYRSAEGFEGFFMMQKMNTPFILFGDPRLEGGAFYLGSEELEAQVLNYIQDKMTLLGFNHQDLILSGLSMGTFGAFYYGAQLNPRAIIVGKPLLSLGTVAKNGHLNRPNEFGTAFDVIRHITGQLSQDALQAVNAKFWHIFHQANLTNTTLAIAYMKHDDYDQHAFNDLVRAIEGRQVKLVAKGLEGRHNDNSMGINMWFLNQYQLIMAQEFGRDVV